PVASVSVAPATATVTTGGTQHLAATLKDASGNGLTGRSVAWTSSNAAVATIGGSGLVTAIAAGSATITAASGGKSGTATITGTTYSFELVAYRGTLNVNAVFGGLSNAASGATTSSSSGGGGSGGGGAPGGGTVLLQENFADGAFAARGWYDNPDMPVTTAQHM